MRTRYPARPHQWRARLHDLRTLPRAFSSQVYGGVYDPGSHLADDRGFRRDVIEALRQIKTPVIRWPGGCFVSAYPWKKGVGRRVPYYDKAWRVGGA